MASIYRDTERFLNSAHLPKNFAHLRSTIEKLPLKSIVEIVFGCSAHGLGDDAVGAALESAVAFQHEESWRCPICFRWQKEQGLVVVAIVEGRVTFHSVCPRCERKHKTVDRIRSAMRSYVVEEVQDE